MKYLLLFVENTIFISHTDFYLLQLLKSACALLSGSYILCLEDINNEKALASYLKVWIIIMLMNINRSVAVYRETKNLSKTLASYMGYEV